MRLMSSLFWQLYISIVGVIVLALLMFVFAFAYFESETDFEDFHFDAYLAAKPLLEVWQRDEKIEDESLEKASHENVFFIAVISNQQYQEIRQENEVFKVIKGAEVYERYDSGLKIALFPLAKSDKWLQVSDPDFDEEDVVDKYGFQDEIEREEREDDQRFLILQMMGICLLSLIGVVMMLAVFRIRRHVDKLAQNSMQLANGEFSVRADEKIPEPLNILAQSFNQMVSELDKYNHEQKVLMGAVSHELRTPLSKISLALNLLSKQVPQLKDQPLYEDLSRYNDELEGLVNQILAFTKLRYGEHASDPHAIDMGRVITERLSDFSRLHQDKAIESRLDEHVVINADAMFIQIILDNILKNAFKYSASKVKVSLSKNASELTVSVEDDGPGVPEELRETMLLPFSRADESRNQKTGGYGLGLAIVDTLVKKQKGQISLGESPLGGLKCSITFPLN